MSDRSVTELRSDEAFKALTRSYDDRLMALESRRTQGDIQLKSLIVNEGLDTAGSMVVGDGLDVTGGVVVDGVSLSSLIDRLAILEQVFGNTTTVDQTADVGITNTTPATAHPLTGTVVTVTAAGFYNVSGFYDFDIAPAGAFAIGNLLVNGADPGLAVAIYSGGSATVTRATVGRVWPPILLAAGGTLQLGAYRAGAAGVMIARGASSGTGRGVIRVTRVR